MTPEESHLYMEMQTYAAGRDDRAANKFWETIELRNHELDPYWQNGCKLLLDPQYIKDNIDNPNIKFAQFLWANEALDNADKMYLKMKWNFE